MVVVGYWNCTLILLMLEGNLSIEATLEKNNNVCFLRTQTLLVFFPDRSSSTLQYAARMMKTLIQMLYLIHIIACAYYKISDYEGLNSNNFVYDGNGTSYIRCFYFATKTATSIGKLLKCSILYGNQMYSQIKFVGKNPKPTNIIEMVFMYCCWMMGVFFFSILVGRASFRLRRFYYIVFIVCPGNIRDIHGTTMVHRNEYRKRLVAISHYMQKFRVPYMVQVGMKIIYSYF